MKTENEKLIERFLFGEMPEDERFNFEERFITDADLFEDVKASEDDLIEKYARGWMNPAEAAKFEKFFLNTNKQRERVEFSRQLINKIEGQKEAFAVKKNAETISAAESFWDKVKAFLLTPKVAVAGALALAIAVFGSWFLYKNLDGNSEIVKNENNLNIENSPEIKTPIPTISPVESTGNNQNNSENVNLESSINSENTPLNSNENVNRTPDKPIETPTPTKTPVQNTAPNPVLALFSGMVRSGGQNNVLNLPKEAKAATLQLNLESSDYKIYSAQLTDADGNVIFQNGKLNARKSKINFTIPAIHLKRGEYIIKLSGKNDAGENESVADFQFRVNQ